MSGSLGGRGWLTAKGHKGTLGDGNVLYHVCGGGYMIVHTFQNSSNCTTKIGTFFVCKLYLKTDYKRSNGFTLYSISLLQKRTLKQALISLKFKHKLHSTHN